MRRGTLTLDIDITLVAGPDHVDVLCELANGALATAGHRLGELHIVNAHTERSARDLLLAPNGADELLLNPPVLLQLWWIGYLSKLGFSPLAAKDVELGVDVDAALTTVQTHWRVEEGFNKPVLSLPKGSPRAGFS